VQGVVEARTRNRSQLHGNLVPRIKAGGDRQRKTGLQQERGDRGHHGHQSTSHRRMPRGMGVPG
jgi:hypothetical protein